MTPYFFALFANLTFATATLFFTHFSRLQGALFMNWFKVGLGVSCFAIAVSLQSAHGLAFLFGVPWTVVMKLILSGAIGLALGDYLLLKGFSHSGAPLILMLFGFQPLILSFVSQSLFGTQLGWRLLTGVGLLLTALLVFLSGQKLVRTSIKETLLGLGFGFSGVLLDAVGVVLTKSAFVELPSLSGFEANFIRASSGFIALSVFILPRFQRTTHYLKHLRRDHLVFLVLASIIGTFVSLAFYLEAVKTGKIAAITAIAATGPLTASLIEHAWHKKWPSFRLLFSFAIFSAGFILVSLSEM